jgi:hypothetical protein
VIARLTSPKRRAAAAKERRERLAAERGTVRCGHCEWSYKGDFRSGILAARAHRRDEHTDLPERSPDPHRSRPSPKADEAARVADHRRAVLEVLERAERPLRAGQIAQELDGVSAQMVGATLRHTLEVRHVSGRRWGRWWLADRPFPADPEPDPATHEPKPRTAYPNAAVRERREEFEAALARMRARGQTTATSDDVAREAGFTSAISAGKLLRHGGYREVGTTRVRQPDGKRRTRPVWDITSRDVVADP